MTATFVHCLHNHVLDHAMYRMKAAKQATPSLPDVKRVSLDTVNRVVILLRSPLEKPVPPLDFFRCSGKARFEKVRREGRHRIGLYGGPFDVNRLYKLFLGDGRQFPILPDGILDRYRTDEPLGLVRGQEGAGLRLFMPRAKSVSVRIYNAPGAAEAREEQAAEQDETTGVWKVEAEHLQPGMAYTWLVEGPEGTETEPGTEYADPYAHAVVKRNNWRRPSRTLVLSEELSQPLDTPGEIISPRNLVIYETHVKDISKLSDAVPHELRGTYLGAAHEGKGTPLEHLGKLGVNAVEWLPLADYDHIEPTYDDPGLPVHNTWNPYSFNHWGYMPAYYFAPEARYTLTRNPKKDAWIGADGSQVNQLRQLVHTLHRNGIAVIFDVVYNHLAQYGENPLRQIDPYYSLRFDREGRRQSVSGCGNDLRTERPMIRRLIIDSLKHWMTVYGADGFRFDLAGLLDAETLAAITRELRAIKPDLHLIAEPWGGRYDKGRFSRVGWASWNDHYRDGIRGTDPEYGKGFVFGQWSPRDGGNALERHVTGNLREDGGPFDYPKHSVNFISCHDGHPIGNFIRVGGEHMNHENSNGNGGKPRSSYAVLSGRDDSRMRLATLLLLTSRGPVMLHQGDEWGRAKVIEGYAAQDPQRGKLDHNSYEKDDPTNWIDWRELERSANRKLLDYTCGLIEVRRKHPAIRLAKRGDLEILTAEPEHSFGYRISVARDDVIVLTNADTSREARFSLPEGRWRVIADHRHADPEKSVGGIRQESIVLPPVAGAILWQPYETDDS